MFNQFKALIKETKQGLSATETNIKKLRDARDFLTKQIANARARLKRKQSGKYPEKLSKALVEQLKKDAPALLIKEIDDAANRKSLEFSNTGYLISLYEVANTKDIYKFLISGSGWSTIVAVEIVFEEVAGDLNDWARGVNLYREQLKTKIVEKGKGSRTKGLLATKWWITNVYGKQGLMKKTVLSRVELSSRKAPFWKLLNNGTVSLASDRPDGSFNPIPQRPTDFIGAAKEAIQKEFKTTFDLEKAKWLEETNLAKSEIEKAVSLRDTFTSGARKLGTDFKQNQAVFNSFGKDKDYVDKNKLADAMRKYRTGEEFERVYISKSKSGKSVYLTSKRLEGLIE